MKVIAEKTHVGVQVASRLQKGVQQLKREIHKVIVGQEEAIDAILCAMLAGGLCLVQGVPGLGKTRTVHAVAKAMSLVFNRVQFTPDLMPSDIIGTDIIQRDPETRKRRYEFLKGPIFANVLLADEIKFVVAESSQGDPEAAARRMSALVDIPELVVTDEVRILARALITEGSIPNKAEIDAYHIAVATVNGMDYLLTWNCTHIANAVMRPKVESICRRHGYEPPIICTPQELMEG